MHKTRNLGSTVYFWFAANDTSGSGADGETPQCDVRLAGDEADAAPVLSPTPTLLTHANYGAGLHEVAIAATAANGFAAGNEYAVFCTLLVDSQNPAGFLGSFYLTAADQAPLTVDDIQNGLPRDDQWTDARAGYLDKLNIGAENSLALEATLAAIKGAGWTNETLVEIMGAIQTFSGTGAFTVSLHFLDGAGTNAGSLKTHIEDESGNLVAGPLVTDVDGTVEFNLDAGDYFVVTPSTALWNGANTPITVMGETTIEIELTLNTIPAPPDADYCRVFVYAKEPDGSVPDSGVFSLERIHSPATVGEGATTVTIVLGDDSRALDDNGYSYLDILQGARVDLALTTHGRKVPILKRNVTVPTAATANWETLA